MDPELQAQLTADAQRAVDEYMNAEAEYQEVLEALEDENPDGFDLLWQRLDKRNVAVLDARKKVKAARCKIGPFRSQSRNGMVFDEDTFVGLARELGCYEELRQAGVIKYTISTRDLKEKVDPKTLERLKESGRVVETSVAIYGPKEMTRLK